MKSMDQTREDLQTSMHTFQTMFQWFEARFTDLNSLHSAVLQVFGNIAYWIRVVLYALLIYIITSIPGVCILSSDQ